MGTKLEGVALPEWSLMAPAARVPGTYADCFRAHVDRAVTLRAFIATFYATPLFRAERMVLQLVFRRRITDATLARLADGHATRFAAWSVAGRNGEQILLKDLSGSTMSWLAVRSERAGTSLLVARHGRMPGFARATLSLHRVYAQALLRSAATRLG